MARRTVAVDEVECFFVDDRLDDLGECFAYQRHDLGLVPTFGETQRCSRIFFIRASSAPK
jgi:hypothetical protein